ncbi:Type 4 prepilin-like proteins leader peptide-processing enzyme (Includes: Leader peptidase; N-methyltransferase) [Crenothrix polyspora]|uniref:Prepilin leader peptidase/N-methyltransferase n=2 Tax=Crenothrix polyspora TaxID=360316 RepID=A0A1R4HC92_9GAMM|nr:A24 family peptidase [Crenothrix polyspora]SJM93872.1 Type 4 prepilin-like proteins leader peptide-processing enzyme (Includes: Leader peptidase; N-methyltransferase) [Crenothrix polyspora]
MLLNNVSPFLLSALVGMIGLLVGSFLNVVIYRLPIMMRRDWRSDCADYLQIELDDSDNDEKPFNLVLPLSRCSACKTPIKPYQNVPVISYVLLGGRCGQCRHPISIRYPAIEVLTMVLSITVAWHLGYTLQTVFALLLTWSLIALSFIDIDQQLLPDSIALPLLWLGLLLSVFNIFIDAPTSIIGACAGYLILWSVYHLFKLATGKEGMGYGDFKLLALFGAWLGWQTLPMIILLSSLVGAIIGSAMIVFGNRDRNTPIPFGPYLAAAGWIALLWGKPINQLYLHIVGL